MSIVKRTPNVSLPLVVSLPCCKRPHSGKLLVNGTIQLLDLTAEDLEAGGHASDIVPAAGVRVRRAVSRNDALPCLTCLPERAESVLNQDAWFTLTDKGKVPAACAEDGDADVGAPAGGAGTGALTVPRVLAQYAEMFKVLYALPTNNVHSLARNKCILPTIVIATMRILLGHTRIFANPYDESRLGPQPSQEEAAALSVASTAVGRAQAALSAFTRAEAANARERERVRWHAEAAEARRLRRRGGLFARLRRLLACHFAGRSRAPAVAEGVARAARILPSSGGGAPDRVATAQAADDAEARAAAEAADTAAREAAEAAERRRVYDEQVAKLTADVTAATGVYTRALGVVNAAKARKQEVSFHCIRSHQQYALDEALVVAAKFVHPSPAQAQECARQYQAGTVKLVPQFCVHNPATTAMMIYEVGCVAREPRAGKPGYNGCVQGLHVHASEAAAMQHARSMCVLEENTHTGSVLALTPVPVYDGPTQPLTWHKWNCLPNPWQNSADAVCLACLGSMNASTSKYAVLDCGHGYLCRTCAGVASETMRCPQCSIDALRISQVW